MNRSDEFTLIFAIFYIPFTANFDSLHLVEEVLFIEENLKLSVQEKLRKVRRMLLALIAAT